MPTRRFVTLLVAVTAVAAVVRIGYVVAVAPDELGADAVWYQLQAGTLANGDGYLDPGLFYGEGRITATANFPPLWPMFLAVFVWAGLDSQTALQLAGAVLGALAVPLTAVIARRVVDPVTALVAGTIVALSPLLIAADGSLMAEPLYVVLVTAAVLVAYLVLDCPSLGRFAGLGAVLGLAALARSDALVLAPVLIVVVAWRAAGPSTRQRVVGAAVAGSVVIGVLAPWALRNTARLDSPVLVSSNSGSLLEGANCESTYEGDLLGAWDFDCLHETRRPGVSETEWASAAREAGTSYATGHAARWPVVGAARVLRVWGLWEPTGPAELEAVESRRYGWQLGGWAYGLVTLAAAVPGVVLLVRRRAEVAPLLAIVGGVTLVALASWGNQRFRLAAEPATAIFAAAAVVALVSRLGSRRSRRTTPSPLGSPRGCG